MSKVPSLLEFQAQRLSAKVQELALSSKGKLAAAGTAVVAFAGTQASAALTAPSLSTTDFETVAGAVIVALGVMWAIKKALGLVRV